MRIKFSETEIIDLLWAWAALTFAFAVLLGGGIGSGFFMFLIISGLTIGLAFILHEMAHKFVAQRYGCWAEFRKWNFGLILAVIMSFLGFIFAAPGAVMISGMVSREQNGKISAAGPLTNIALAALFLLAKIFLLPQITGEAFFFVGLIVHVGLIANAFLAVFNLLPIPPLDGSKIMPWSFSLWLGIMVLAGFLVVIGYNSLRAFLS